MANFNSELWELWYPEAGATGMLIARAKIDAAAVIWTHAVPEVVSVTVRDLEGGVVATGPDLRREGARLPMTRFWRKGDAILREDRWPNDEDLGAVVILPGGEAGVLKSWWNREDEKEWRWQVEFYNRVD